MMHAKAPHLPSATQKAQCKNVICAVREFPLPRGLGFAFTSLVFTSVHPPAKPVSPCLVCFSPEAGVNFGALVVL